MGEGLKLSLLLSSLRSFLFTPSKEIYYATIPLPFVYILVNSIQQGVYSTLPSDLTYSSIDPFHDYNGSKVSCLP